MPSGASERDVFMSQYHDAAPALHVWATVRIGAEMRAFCEVADLLQEVWCRAYAIRERFDPGRTEFRPWIFRIAKNVLLEVLRHARRTAGVARPCDGHTSRVLRLEGVADEVTSITRRLARDDALRTFHQRLQGLPAEDRDLVLYLGLEGMTAADAATQLGLSYETVKKRWQRLRARLDLAGTPVRLLDGESTPDH
jgi:RNA polymerase sigma-70 factor (ECF subfamily)